MSIFRRYTLQSLRHNKSRTFVTIVGIVLSVAMITAVTTSVSSLLNYMMEVVIEDQGCWHVSVGRVDEEKLRSALEKEDVEKSAVLRDVAYGKLETVKRERTPYLYISGFSGDFTELLSLHMKEGRLPENSSELIVPAWLADRAGIPCKVGESIEIETGVRKQKENGELIWQDHPYTDQEIFEGNGKKAYQIVGIYESADFGYWEVEEDMAGFPVLTRDEAAAPADTAVSSGGGMAYLTIRDLDHTNEFIQTLEDENGELYVSQNHTYLKLVKGDREDSMFKMLTCMAVILIAIIMFGSVCLIYNSFAISVNERKRQYGLLNSIGATPKQLRTAVVFEAVVLSAIGIPVGVLVGIGGMSLVFYLLRDTFQAFLNVGAAGAVIHMSAAVWAVVLAAAVGFITVLISAYLPARKAMKINAIDAIRQTTDIAVKPGRLKTFRLTERVFGLEGMLGSKNYKRNKKRYRATVFSLFISVVLFISASSFSGYLSYSLKDIMRRYDCDIQYSSHIGTGKESEQLFHQMEQVNGVTDRTWHYNFWEARLEIPKECLSGQGAKGTGGLPDLKEDGQDEKIGEGNVVYSNIIVSFIQDKEYEEYLRANGIDPEPYLNKENPAALIFDKDVVLWSTDEDRYVYSRIFKENPETAKLSFEIWPESKENEEGQGEWIDPYISGKRKISIGEIRNETMKGFDYEQYLDPVILFPMSAMDRIIPEDERAAAETVMTFKAEEPDMAYVDMQDILDQNGTSGNLTNIADQIRMNRALMMVLNVFSYGFILLISLIAVANVFNTISTNVFLRRREFAMLRSVGMTQKGFRRMMNYECVLYGVKGLVYGLPVAIAITALIWYVVKDEVAVSFYIPWQSIVIAVGSVFLVVFVTMVYSFSKIRRDHVADTLKGENY